jgi:predicted PurR-regulated permease PerM
MDQRPGKNTTRAAAVILLTLGCLYVLRPFLAAILFAAAVVISSWPLYLKLRAHARTPHAGGADHDAHADPAGHDPAGAGRLQPGRQRAAAFEELRKLSAGDLHPPPWVRGLPLVGEQLDTYLNELVASRDRMMELARRMAEPARNVLVAGGIVLGTGVVQMSLAAFVSFFFYRDGEP